MSTHAERIREAEREVVEAAVAQANAWSGMATGWRAATEETERAADVLLALRAATCPTCGGTGERFGYDKGFGVCAQPCPAGCEAGKRRDA